MGQVFTNGNIFQMEELPIFDYDGPAISFPNFKLNLLNLHKKQME